jgi:spermidine synthase
MGPPLLYVAFFCSGVSGLIYQVAWVRQFGLVFGNTLHSASLVVAVFMLGLGAGACAAGAWADRRFESNPRSPLPLLHAYAALEGLIAALGLAVSFAVPHMAALIAAWSSYGAGPHGWQALTTASYVARAAAAAGLLLPVTAMMGATLTILIRYVARTDMVGGAGRVALLYGVNTIGAAAGALLTDFVIVPRAGLSGAQLVAVGLNLLAAGVVLVLARTTATFPERQEPPAAPGSAAPSPADDRPGLLAAVSLALALSGFASMGMEILWLRHFTLLLGGFRAVFSLVLATVLVGIGAGSLLGGWWLRRGARPAGAFMITQALFVVCALLGLASARAASLAEGGGAAAATLGSLGPLHRLLVEVWHNLRPMLLEVGLPALLAGASFPLANATVQRSSHDVGRRAGSLYLANTAGAVCGSLVTGYLLLPWLGLQAAAAALTGAAALAIVPVAWARPGRWPVAVAALTATASLAAWLGSPPDYLLRRALLPHEIGERVLASSEGTTEFVEVVEIPGRGRGLLTNGHAMSSTAPLDQRYMRALAHIPLLAMSHPARALVIGFGVGNSAHAATLHPSIERVDVAETSSHVLAHEAYFRDANQNVLSNPKVSVYLNDGRQHLQMMPAGTYDLVTLEPPPIAHAGVGSLYSREFYTLVRSRLKPGGYVSQWLPAYQVPADASLAMVRAFIDVFPQAVLLSGTQAELLLVGTTGPRIEIDPERLARALAAAPEVRMDLRRLDLATPREIVGMFVGSPDTLRRATREAADTTDDRPLQEYGVLSDLGTGLLGVPAGLFDLDAVDAWCPRCFVGGAPVTAVAGLDVYLALLREAYTSPVGAVAAAATARGTRPVLGSTYLGRVLPDSPEVFNIVGIAERRAGRVADATRAFEEALRRNPASAAARSNLGQIRLENGAALVDARRFPEAEVELRQAVEMLPGSAEALNDLGVALASTGQIAAALPYFRRAVEIQPTFAEAQRNLAAAETALR